MCPSPGGSPHWAHGHTKYRLRTYKRSAGCCFARPSTVSLPGMPQCPRTHNRMTLLQIETLLTASITSATRFDVTFAAANTFSAALLSEQIVTDDAFSSSNLGIVAQDSIANISVWNTVLTELRGNMYPWSSSWVYIAAPEGPVSPRLDPFVKQTISSEWSVVFGSQCTLI